MTGLSVNVGVVNAVVNVVWLVGLVALGRFKCSMAANLRGRLANRRSQKRYKSPNARFFFQ